MNENLSDDGLSEDIGKSRLGERLWEMSVPEIRSLVENDIYYPDRSPVIIEGLLRTRETMNVIAAPKTGKTWLMMQLAVSIALGKPWLGRVVTQKKILVIDNELHPGELNWRYQQVCRAMGVTLAETEGLLYLWPQRGKLKSLEEIGARLKDLEALGIEVVLLDAFYRAIPAGVDENSNTEIMQLYNKIDLYAKELRSAFILVHHTTKGSQKEKAITDIGAGAGSQSRAADTHLILLPTEDKRVVEIKGVPRSFEPVEPFEIEQKNFPLWNLVKPMVPKIEQMEYRDLVKEKNRVASVMATTFEGKKVYKTVLRDQVAREFHIGTDAAELEVSQAIQNGYIQVTPTLELGRTHYIVTLP